MQGTRQGVPVRTVTHGNRTGEKEDGMRHLIMLNKADIRSMKEGGTMTLELGGGQSVEVGMEKKRTRVTQEAKRGKKS